MICSKLHVTTCLHTTRSRDKSRSKCLIWLFTRTWHELLQPLHRTTNLTELPCMTKQDQTLRRILVKMSHLISSIAIECTMFNNLHLSTLVWVCNWHKIERFLSKGTPFPKKCRACKAKHYYLKRYLIEKKTHYHHIIRKENNACFYYDTKKKLMLNFFFVFFLFFFALLTLQR